MPSTLAGEDYLKSQPKQALTPDLKVGAQRFLRPILYIHSVLVHLEGYVHLAFCPLSNAVSHLP